MSTGRMAIALAASLTLIAACSKPQEKATITAASQDPPKNKAPAPSPSPAPPPKNDAFGCGQPPAEGVPKYYVGIDLDNHSKRSDADLRRLVIHELGCRLLTMKGRFVIADDVDKGAMHAVVVARHLQGWYLRVRVDPIVTDATGRRVDVKLAMFTEDRDLKGELSSALKMTNAGIAKGDEDDLLKAAGQRLADAFAKQAP